jgi:hypothetical protein
MIALEKRLNHLEDSVNYITGILNLLYSNTELNEVRESIDKQLLEVKQRLSILKQNVAMIKIRFD